MRFSRDVSPIHSRTTKQPYAPPSQSPHSPPPDANTTSKVSTQIPNVPTSASGTSTAASASNHTSGIPTSISDSPSPAPSPSHSPAASPVRRDRDRDRDRDRLRSTSGTLGSSSTSIPSARTGLSAVGRVASRVRLSFIKPRLSDGNLSARLGVREKDKDKDKEKNKDDVNESPWGVGTPSTRNHTYLSQNQEPFKDNTTNSIATTLNSKNNASNTTSTNTSTNNSTGISTSTCTTVTPPLQQQQDVEPRDRPRPHRPQPQQRRHGFVKQPVRKSIDNAFFSTLVSPHSPTSNDDDDEYEDDDDDEETVHGDRYFSSPSSCTLSPNDPIVQIPDPSPLPRQLSAYGKGARERKASSPPPTAAAHHVVRLAIESPTAGDDSAAHGYYTSPHEAAQEDRYSNITPGDGVVRMNPFKFKLKNGVFVPDANQQQQLQQQGVSEQKNHVHAGNLGPPQMKKKSASICTFDHQATIGLLDDDDEEEEYGGRAKTYSYEHHVLKYDGHGHGEGDDDDVDDDEIDPDATQVESKLFRAPVFHHMRTGSLPEDNGYGPNVGFGGDDSATATTTATTAAETAHAKHDDNDRKDEGLGHANVLSQAQQNKSSSTSTSTASSSSQQAKQTPRNPKTPQQFLRRPFGLKRHRGGRGTRFGGRENKQQQKDSGSLFARGHSASADDRQEDKGGEESGSGGGGGGLRSIPYSTSSGRHGGKTRSGWWTNLISSIHGTGESHNTGNATASSSTSTRLSRYDLLLGRKKSRDRDRDSLNNSHRPQDYQNHQQTVNSSQMDQQDIGKKIREKDRPTNRKHFSEFDFVDDELYNSEEDEEGAKPDVVVPSLARDDFVAYQTNQKRKGNKERNKPRVSMMWM